MQLEARLGCIMGPEFKKICKASFVSAMPSVTGKLSATDKSPAWWALLKSFSAINYMAV